MIGLLCAAGVWRNVNSETLIVSVTWHILWMPGVQQQNDWRHQKSCDKGYKKNSRVRSWRKYMEMKADVRMNKGLIQERQEDQSGWRWLLRTPRSELFHLLVPWDHSFQRAWVLVLPGLVQWGLTVPMVTQLCGWCNMKSLTSPLGTLMLWMSMNHWLFPTGLTCFGEISEQFSDVPHPYACCSHGL